MALSEETERNGENKPAPKGREAHYYSTLYAGCAPVYNNRSVDSIRSLLAREYAVDLKAQSRKIARDFKRCSPLPFFLPEPARQDGGRVFVPFKMRRPKVPRDRVYGYIDLDQVDHLEPAANNCIIYLANGSAVELFCSTATARASLALGEDVALRYLRPHPAEDDRIIQGARLLLERLNRIESHLQELGK